VPLDVSEICRLDSGICRRTGCHGTVHFLIGLIGLGELNVSELDLLWRAGYTIADLGDAPREARAVINHTTLQIAGLIVIR